MNNRQSLWAVGSQALSSDHIQERVRPSVPDRLLPTPAHSDPKMRRHPPGRARKDLRGCAVLLVEDDFDEARDTQQALQHAGARVIGPFEDSQSALRCIAAGTPSCAIVNIGLRDGRGVSIASALTDKSVPIIFVIGAGLIPSEFSLAPVIQKPVEFRSLLRLIAQLSRKDGCSD